MINTFEADKTEPGPIEEYKPYLNEFYDKIYNTTLSFKELEIPPLQNDATTPIFFEAAIMVLWEEILKLREIIKANTGR